MPVKAAAKAMAVNSRREKERRALLPIAVMAMTRYTPAIQYEPVGVRQRHWGLIHSRNREGVAAAAATAAEAHS